MCTCNKEIKRTVVDFGKPIEIEQTSGHIVPCVSIGRARSVGLSSVYLNVIQSTDSGVLYRVSDYGEIDGYRGTVRNVQKKVKKITISFISAGPDPEHVQSVTKNADEFRGLKVGDLYNGRNRIVHIAEFEIVA